MSLKTELQAYLNEPKHLQEIYQALPEYPRHSIRGRLNENLDKVFKRISRGVYLAVNGDAKALIIEGDCWKEIKNFEDDAIDTIITDSPYSCLNHHLATGTTRKKDNKWSFETKDIDKELLGELYRILKPNGHAYFFLPPDSKDTLGYNGNFVELALQIGFTFNKRLIWDKQAIGMGYSFRNRYEQILFLSKGKRHKGHDLSVPDVLSHKRISPAQRKHEAEKPIELIKDLLRFSTREGEVCLDVFAGSFSTVKACLELGINGIGIEINPSYIEQAAKDLNANVMVDE